MFGGTRDVDWTHVRVDGDRARAAAYIPQGRLLLGAAKQTFESTGVSMPFRRRFSNGVVVEASYIAKTPRITIYVPPPGGRRLRPPLLDGYLTLPVFESTLAGVSPDSRQDYVVLNIADTTTFFYEPFQPYWGRITNGKFVYKERNGEPLYKNGMAGAASAYWVGPDGVVLSWPSPTTEHGYLEKLPPNTRIAQDTPNGRYRTTQRFLPRWTAGVVYNMGLPVFVVEDYRDENGTLVGAGGYDGVAGAAYRRDDDGVWLYVAQFRSAVGPWTDPNNTRRYSEDGGIRIARYRLAPKSAEQPFLGRVVNGSREWVTPEMNLDGQWNLVTDVMFNGSCSAAMVVLSPSPDTLTITPGPTFEWASGRHAVIRTVDLATGGWADSSTASSTTVTGNSGSGSIAFDCFHCFRGDTPVSYRFSISGGFANMQATLTTPRGQTLPLYSITDIGFFRAAADTGGTGPQFRKYIAKTIHHVSPRTGHVVLLGVDNTNAPAGYRTWIEVWQEEVDPLKPATLTKVYESPMYTRPVVPFPPVDPAGFSLPWPASYWHESAGFGYHAGGDTDFFSWLARYDQVSLSSQRLPYDVFTGLEYGLTSDLVLGPWMKSNVFNTVVFDVNGGFQAYQEKLAGPGRGTRYRNAHTRFCAYKDTWVLFTYVPMSSTERLVVVSDGTSVSSMVGAANGDQVATEVLVPIGKPIFLPGT